MAISKQEGSQQFGEFPVAMVLPPSFCQIVSLPVQAGANRFCDQNPFRSFEKIPASKKQ
jgi:hypothetical protein